MTDRHPSRRPDTPLRDKAIPRRTDWRICFKLIGKVAIVWGGGQGMGDARRCLPCRGRMRCAGGRRRIERAERVSDEIRGSAGGLIRTCADITREDQVVAAVDASDRELGPVDCMVTVVGMAFWADLFDVTEEIWEKSFDVNLQVLLLHGSRGRNSAAPKREARLDRRRRFGQRPAVCAGPSSLRRRQGGLVNLVRTMAVDGARTSAITRSRQARSERRV